MEKPLIKRWMITVLLIALLGNCLGGSFAVSADTLDIPTGVTYALCGDVNNDDAVSALDALGILRVIVGKDSADDRCSVVADVNADQSISAVDALSVLQYIVGKINSFPAGIPSSCLWVKVHKWGEWKMTFPSTIEKQGWEQRICSVCGIYEQRQLPLSTISMDEFYSQMLTLVNQERAKVGVAPLAYYAKPQQIATLRANDLNQRFDHIRPDGTPWHALITSSYNNWLNLGENIAMGQISPEKALASWMNSPGHRAAILSSDFTHLTVGVAPCRLDGFYGYCWVQIFWELKK